MNTTHIGHRSGNSPDPSPAVAGTPARESEDRLPGLLPLLLSGLGMLLLIGLCVMGYRAIVKTISLRLAEEHSVTLATAIARELEAELAELLAAPGAFDEAAVDIVGTAAFTGNEFRLQALLHDARVHHFDILTPAGLVVYSSDSDRIGTSRSADAGFRAARAGMVRSRLHDRPSHAADTPPHAHMITFAPIRGGANHTVLAVLGVHGVADPDGPPDRGLRRLLAGTYALPPLLLLAFAGMRAWRRSRAPLSPGQVGQTAAVGLCHTIAVQETERKRISRDLHDGISQYLNAIKIHLQHIATDRDERLPPDTRQELEGIVRFVTSASDEVRRISLALRPTMLDDLGLLATLNWLCREFANAHPDIALEKHVTVTEQDIPDRLKTPIYRILQEALTNAAKHSRASWVDVVLEKRTEANGPVLVLTVADDGDGFDLAEVQCRRRGDGGLGLCSMRERAEFDGGSFRIRSERKSGTRIEASWPSG